MAIVVPAVGDTGTAAWADSVANFINAFGQTVSFVPGGTITTPASGTATWATLGNVTVPTWSTTARVTMHVNGWSGSIVGATCLLFTKLGSVSGANKRITATATSRGYTASWADRLTGLSSGSQSLTVQATFQAGTFSTDNIGSFDATIDFLP